MKSIPIKTSTDLIFSFLTDVRGTVWGNKEAGTYWKAGKRKGRLFIRREHLAPELEPSLPTQVRTKLIMLQYQHKQCLSADFPNPDLSQRTQTEARAEGNEMSHKQLSWPNVLVRKEPPQLYDTLGLHCLLPMRPTNSATMDRFWDSLESGF